MLNFDLFNGETPIPGMASLLNSQHGFIDWWLSYPRTNRKVAKQQCLDKWARFECAAAASHILAHTEWMKTQPDWMKDNGAYVCAPLVYLNQRRWEDWEMPAPAAPKHDILAELKSHKGTKPSAETLAKIEAAKQRLRG